jgi:hypothetical protein
MDVDENSEKTRDETKEETIMKSGKSLEKWIHTFLSKISEKTIKSDSISKNHLKVTIFRSNPFENLIAELKKVSVTGRLAHQHDAIKVFLNHILLQGQFSALEQRNSNGVNIDITHSDIAHELKTRKNVSHSEIKTFIADYFKDMIKMRSLKHRWWLVFFMKRTDWKAKKGRVCMYYLILIEINVKQYQDFETSFNKISEDVMQMVESVKKKVAKEDEIDDTGILVPVENILVVDSLREEVQEKDALLQEKDALLQEKDELIRNYKSKYGDL